ncbi:DUF4083 family protein [Paenibacillus sp. BSR1-1]|uniref:DUF4083 family protein n=1 Tax=Paenibacillus sp. BSR1-1 TaxID=3020845 RepID=UPI00339D5DBE
MVRVGFNMSIIDLIIKFGIFFVIFFLYGLYLRKRFNKSNNIEKKLDRIIELLEKDT